MANFIKRCLPKSFMHKQKTVFSGGGNGISKGSLKGSALCEPGWKGVEKLTLWINDYAAKINQNNKTVEFLWLVLLRERWFDLCNPKRYANEEKGQVGAAISNKNGEIHLLKTYAEHEKFRSENRACDYEYWVLEPMGEYAKKIAAEKLKEHPLYGGYAALFPDKTAPSP